GASRTFVFLLQRSDVQIHGGEVVQVDAGGWTALKPRQSLHVPPTSPAPFHDGGCPAILRYERDQFFMVCCAAVRARQDMGFPLTSTPPTAEIPAPLDAAYFRQRRPGTAERTVPFAPVAIDRGRPASVARLKERDGQHGDDGLEPRRIGTDHGGGSCPALT